MIVVCWPLVRRREPRRRASSFVRTRSERSSAGARRLTPQPTRTLALSAGGGAHGAGRALTHRAVDCRLLQRAACHEAYGVAHTAALILRTKGGKPYLAARPDTALEGTAEPGPNWNFNVSHEGHYVVLAAEPLLLCGVDVAAPDQSRVRGKPRPLEEHFATMKDCPYP